MAQCSLSLVFLAMVQSPDCKNLGPEDFVEDLNVLGNIRVDQKD